jgi:SAM-dependent methyltransferase
MMIDKFSRRFVVMTSPLHLDAPTFRTLLELQGPSLGLWRAAEIAVLREQIYTPPILDLGCGNGLVTSFVLSKVDIGLDPDEKELACAAQRAIYSRFEAVPAEESDLPDASIGTVVSNSVLEHLPRIDDVLAMIARVLRPGGRLIFTAPTETFSSWLALPLTPYAGWRNSQLQHLNLWSTEQWYGHLLRVGLQVEVVRPYLRRSLVSLWDMLELWQQIWLFRRRLVSLLWRRIPSALFEQMAHWASHLDLAAPVPGGGRLIVARKLYA